MKQLSFFNQFTGQTVTPSPRQLALKPGDYYAITRPTVALVDALGLAEIYDNVPTVYGHIITNEPQPGYFLVRGFSQWCPDGELGTFNICEATTHPLTPQQFEAARAAGWPKEIPPHSATAEE